MTTATKPLAEHGTTARAKGRPAAGIKGCPCRPCRDAENAYDKRRRFLNETGRGVRVEAGPATAHLKGLFADGAGWNQLVAATGCSSSTLNAIFHGQRTEISRRVSSLILAVRAADVQPPNRIVSGLGSMRRCRALVALGHRVKDITEASPLDGATIRQIVNGNSPTISAATAAGVATAYRRLSAVPGDSARSLNRASLLRWGTPATWDDETIDDPNAAPDWTGFCGTDRGYWTHRLRSIPMCEPCADAQRQWMNDRAHLDPIERNRQRFAARAAAGTRGADIAHDGRELMRHGCDYDTAAARIGVTRQHLQQELQRHPAPAAAA